MTGVDEAVAAAPERVRSTFRWAWAILVAVGLAVLAGALLVGFPVAIVVAFGMVIGGGIYGVVALAVISWRWYRVPRSGAAVPEGGRPDPEDIAGFRTAPQRFTFVLNLVLFANLAAAGVVLALGAANRFEDSGIVLMICGVVAEAFGIALIVVNALWAYRSRYILAEQHALTERTGAHRLILGNRILSYAVWVPYTAAALVIWAQQVIG